MKPYNLNLSITGIPNKHLISALFVAFFLMSFTDRIFNNEKEIFSSSVELNLDHGDPVSWVKSTSDSRLSTLKSGRPQGSVDIVTKMPSSPLLPPMNFEAGACIIDLGITTSYNAGLKPYGLVYDLVKNHKYPVYWVIDPAKSFVNPTAKSDQIDFTVNGIYYRTGAFIISAEYAALPAVQTIINSWVSANPGLTVRCNQPAFTAPVHAELTSFPRAALDENNGNLAISAFFASNRSGIAQFYNANSPNTSPYYFRQPSTLSLCDDIYIMPHADPHKWNLTERTAFTNFINGGGWLFAACHSPSALESTLWPEKTNGISNMALLSNEGLVEWGKHNDGTPPYSYSTGTGQYYNEPASDPFMQFIGTIDGAIQNGSEQIYIPYAAGWRSTTIIGVYDPDHPERPAGSFPTNAAALVAYGRSFGNPNLGMVIYEASHSFAGGNTQQNISAARVLGNFWFQSGVESRPIIIPTSTPPSVVGSGATVTLAVDVTVESPPATFQWTSSCPGTFSTPNSPTTQWTAPIVNLPTTCILRVTVTDQCGRLNYENFVISIDPAADLSLTKTVSNITPNVGDFVTFTVTVANAGTADATGVSVEDVVPGGYSNIGNISGGGTLSGNVITWSGLSIANGGSVALTFTAQVDPPTGTPSEYLNYAQVSNSDQFDPDSTPGNDSTTEDDDDTEEVTPQVSDLSLVKSVSNASPNVGDVVTFTITVTNDGPDGATGVSVEDVVPGGYSNIGNISGGGTLSGNVITWSGLSIANGGSVALTFTAQVDPPTGTPSEYLNYAQVSNSDQFDPDSTPGNDSTTEDDDDTEEVTPQVSDLSLVKSVSNAMPNVGDVVTFTITVTNDGPDGATGVSVEDVVPGGYSNIGNISGGGTLSGNVITWSGLSIANGGSVALTFTAQVDPPTGTPSEYLNYTQVTGSDQYDPDSTPDNDSSTEDDDDTEEVTPQVSDLSLVKSVSNATPNVGDVVTFTITVTNDGPDGATGVSVEDVVPGGYSNIGNISGGGTLSGNVITWSGLSIANGGSVALTFTAQVDPPTGTPSEYLNYAQVSNSDQFDPDSTPGNDSTTEDDDDTEEVTPQVSDLSLVKSVSNASPNVGDVVTFTITVTNDGPDGATGVSVEDVVPGGYSNIGNISGGGTLSGNVITWSGLSIANGGSVALTFTAQVDPPTGTPSEYLNYTQVTRQ
jgi:uncharacterized repeat protein (TIGR01451 family)